MSGYVPGDSTHIQSATGIRSALVQSQKQFTTLVRPYGDLGDAMRDARVTDLRKGSPRHREL